MTTATQLRRFSVLLAALVLPLATGCGFDRRRPATAKMAQAVEKPVETPALSSGNHSSDQPERVTAFKPPLRLGSGFREKDLKDTTIDALARIGGDAVDPLIAALSDAEPAVRTAAAKALAAIGPDASRATPALMRALDDRDERVRVAAARALGQIGPAAHEAIPALLQVLREEAVRERREAGQ